MDLTLLPCPQTLPLHGGGGIPAALRDGVIDSLVHLLVVVVLVTRVLPHV